MAIKTLFLHKPLELEEAALDLFDILKDFINEANIEWKNCIGICTNDARATSGKF